MVHELYIVTCAFRLPQISYHFSLIAFLWCISFWQYFFYFLFFAFVNLFFQFRGWLVIRLVDWLERFQFNCMIFEASSASIVLKHSFSLHNFAAKIFDQSFSFWFSPLITFPPLSPFKAVNFSSPNYSYLSFKSKIKVQNKRTNASRFFWAFFF